MRCQLDDTALKWIMQHTCSAIQHKSNRGDREVTLNVWSSSGDVSETVEAMLDVFEEALQLEVPKDILDIFGPKGLKGREIESFLAALRSVSAQIGRGEFCSTDEYVCAEDSCLAWLPRARPGSDTEDQWLDEALLDWISIDVIGEHVFPTHQPSSFAALYESLEMGTSAVSGYSLVQMMASLSDDFMEIVRRYLSTQGDFWEMIQADTGLDFKAMLKQWKSAKTLPTIRVEQVAGGYALAQEGMDVGYT